MSEERLPSGNCNPEQSLLHCAGIKLLLRDYKIDFSKKIFLKQFTAGNLKKQIM